MQGYPRRTSFVALLFVAAACVTPSGGNGSPSPSHPPIATATIPIKVTVKPGGKESCLTVEPRLQFIKDTESVTFQFKGIPSTPTAHELEIDFLPDYGVVSGTYEVVKGPFPRGPKKNPNRGRYLGEDDNLDTVTLAPDHVGYWKYQVVLRDANGDAPNCEPLDPGLIVKN